MSYNLINISLCHLLLILLGSCNPGCHYNVENNIANVIDLKSAELINELATGNAFSLIDEQTTAMDILSGKCKTLKTKWIPERRTAVYPVSVILNLKSSHFLKSIVVFDSENIEIRTGTPFQWDALKIPVKQENSKFETYEFNDTTQFIQITVLSGIGPSEILCIGSKINKQEGKIIKPITKRPPVKMKDFIGINSFVDDPFERLKHIKVIREYHNWLWDEGNQWPLGPSHDGKYPGYPLNKNRFQPSYAEQWLFDDYYRKCNENGIMVSPVLQGSVDWISDKFNDKPISNRNPLDPASYIEHADHLFQMAARYGKSKTHTQNLKLSPEQEPVSGTDNIKYLENWNEPDNWWSGRNAYFTPYEFAAMSSADYDGHLGKLGSKVGMKNADSSINMVLGGLASLNLDYIKAINFWCRFNRNGTIPYEVINLHHYNNIDGYNNKYAICPEQDFFRERAKQVVKFRDEEMPDKEVWISEFGFDTHPLSIQGVPRMQYQSREEIQAHWIIRAFLELSAAGVDRAMMYMFRDAYSDGQTKYATSGLTKDPAHNWEIKTSWYYLNTLICILGEMVFVEDIQNINKVRIYKYMDSISRTYALVIWSPTGKGKEIKNVNVPIPENTVSLEIVNFEKHALAGTRKKIPNNKILNFTVREKPFILLGKY